jgi:hypothetical protein
MNRGAIYMPPYGKLNEAEKDAAAQFPLALVGWHRIEDLREMKQRAPDQVRLKLALPDICAPPDHPRFKDLTEADLEWNLDAAYSSALQEKGLQTARVGWPGWNLPKMGKATAQAFCRTHRAFLRKYGPLGEGLVDGSHFENFVVDPRSMFGTFTDDECAEWEIAWEHITTAFARMRQNGVISRLTAQRVSRWTCRDTEIAMFHGALGGIKLEANPRLRDFTLAEWWNHHDLRGPRCYIDAGVDMAQSFFEAWLDPSHTPEAQEAWRTRIFRKARSVGALAMTAHRDERFHREIPEAME